MRTVVILVFVVLALSLCSCMRSAPQQTQTQTDNIQAVKLMPPGYTNATDLGNRWYTFDLEVAGQKRTFLLHWWYGSHGEVGTCITEMK